VKKGGPTSENRFSDLPSPHQVRGASEEHKKPFKMILNTQNEQKLYDFLHNFSWVLKIKVFKKEVNILLNDARFILTNPSMADDRIVQYGVTRAKKFAQRS
jgi:hypothetical protein